MKWEQSWTCLHRFWHTNTLSTPGLIEIVFCKSIGHTVSSCKVSSQLLTANTLHTLDRARNTASTPPGSIPSLSVHTWGEAWVQRSQKHRKEVCKRYSL